MKLMNYDLRDLVMQNLKVPKKETPIKYSKTQYNILCNLIRRKHITKQFFDLLLKGLYDLENWKELNYEQMYELIFILSHFDFTRVKM